MFKAACALGLILLIGCTHSQTQTNPTADSRDPASTANPNDFEAERYHFDGSLRSVIDELKLMRGNLERHQTLSISTRRTGMLENNLFDTGSTESGTLDCQNIMAKGRSDFLLFHRTADGSCYMHRQSAFFKKQGEADLSNLQKMGARGARFGRNTPPPSAEEAAAYEANILQPNPVAVSKAFFSRKDAISPSTQGFQPVPWVNLLATAWLQAENHDWFSHGKNVNPDSKKPSSAEYAKMFQPYQVEFEGITYVIPRTKPDLSALKSQGPGQKYNANGTSTNLETSARYDRKYRNAVTHWWDASHIYGSDSIAVRKVRTIPDGLPGAGTLYPNGKIAVDEVNRRLYYRPDPTADGELLPITGFHDNWWIGLELIHTVFALEHNRVATALKEQFDNPNGNEANKEIFKIYKQIAKDEAKRSDFLFEKARLVVSALIAKIHTVEWTPAILDNPGLRMGMFTNWHGLKTALGDPESPLARSFIQAVGGKDVRMLTSGLTGPGTLNLYNVPFTLTEEFVSVYRMHPLLADNVKVMRHNAKGDQPMQVVEVNSTRDSAVDAIYKQAGAQGSLDWLYSFGRNKAGLMTLHNYPRFMEDMEVRRNIAGQRQNAPIRMNMGATDILRDRERHIPRYNAFRRALGLRAIGKFEELFVTSHILYMDIETQSKAYEAPREYVRVVNSLIEKAKRDGYDVPKATRDLPKISSLNPIKVGKDFIQGGFAGVLQDGNKLIPEPVFYELYNALSELDQQALLTRQEKIDVEKMKSLYKDDVEQLDLLVGTLGEKDRFDAFGFGNTPFYIFALMASRRLMTDPFFSDLYNKDVYSPVGYDWVEKETMVSVITRNFPELAPKLKGVKNAFHPWNPN